MHLEVLGPVVLFAALIFFLGTVSVWGFSRSRKYVTRWAQENGFTLDRCEWHFSGGTPFHGLRSGSGWQIIWTVRITDREGQSKDGWVRCGHPLFGMLSSEVEVRWAAPGQSAFR